jgi:hypothetical protein
MKWRLKACPVCGGDLHDDLEDRGWVTCFLCARSFRESEIFGHADPAMLSRVGAGSEPTFVNADSLATKRAKHGARGLAWVFITCDSVVGVAESWLIYRGDKRARGGG